MSKNNLYMTALEHVQEDFAEEYKLWLKAANLSPSEETAMSFLEDQDHIFTL